MAHNDLAPPGPNQIFAETHGIVEYHSQVERYPKLMEKPVEFICQRAINVAMSKVSPDDTTNIFPELATKALVKAIDAETLNPRMEKR